MNFFQYLPLIGRISAHQAEIEQLKALTAPTLAEFQKVWPQVKALLAPTFTEAQKVWSQVVPLAIKLYKGILAPQ